MLENLPEGVEKYLFSAKGGDLESQFAAATDGYKLFSKTGRIKFSVLRSVWSFIDETKPDVLCSWGGWIGALSAGLIGSCRRLPHVNCSIRSAYPSNRRAILKRISLIFSQRIVSNSQAGLDSWHKSKKGTVIYNGFDEKRVSDIDPVANKDIDIVMVGRFTPEKDFKLFFDAAVVLLARNNNEKRVRFIAIGRGSDMEGLQKTYSRSAASGEIVFTGFVKEPLKIVQRCSIGVLLTNKYHHSEGCSNSVMEYMACSLPVVVTDSGGNREIVQDEVTGFLVPSGSLESVISSLQLLIEKDAIRRKMGLAGRFVLQDRLSMTRMVEEYTDLFRSLSS